jgi:hypothetical protein
MGMTMKKIWLRLEPEKVYVANLMKYEFGWIGLWP